MNGTSDGAVHGGASFRAIGEDFATIDRRHTVVNADVLDAWYPPPPSVVDLLSRDLGWLTRTSPPVHAEGLRQVIAKARGCGPEFVLVGGGSSALMYSALRALCQPSSSVRLLDPTYSEYHHLFARVFSASVEGFGLDEESRYQVPLQDLKESAQKSDVVALVNPNNPTAQYLTRRDLLDLLDSLRRSTYLVVDETYVDFLETRETLEQDVVNHPNLIVLKSMSKYYALSGLRVGYVVAHPDVVRQMQWEMPPWSAGTLAQAAACHCLEQDEYYRHRVLETNAMREQLRSQLSGLEGIGVISDLANFLLLRIRDDVCTATSLVERLRRRNVFLRDCTSQSDRFRGQYVRLAVKHPEANRRALEALEEVLAELSRR